MQPVDDQFHRCPNTGSRVHRPRSRPLHGFTLIELLVVIAIISLLVSIMLPSLNRAKELARSVACAANMKSISIASHLYSSEHNSRFVSVDHTTFGAGTPWIGYSVWATGGQKDAEYFEIAAIENDERPLYSYLANVEIWKCLSDDSRNTFWTDIGLSRPEFYHAYGSSYGFNSLCLGWGETYGLWGKRRGRVVRPSDTVEYHEFAQNFWQSGGDQGIRAHNPDAPWCYLLFTDGHVSFHLMEAWPVYGMGTAGYTFAYDPASFP